MSIKIVQIDNFSINTGRIYATSKYFDNNHIDNITAEMSITIFGDQNETLTTIVFTVPVETFYVNVFLFFKISQFKIQKGKVSFQIYNA